MVRVKHVIYSRVESKYSPKKEAGYQIVYASSHLALEDIEAIEKRVKCFHYGNNTKLVRHQFFWTPGNMAALIKSIPVEGHREIIDRNGRDGAFIAHTILLSQDDFNSINNDPFAVFESATDLFANTPEQLRDYLEHRNLPESVNLVFRKTVKIPEQFTAKEWRVLFETGSYGAEAFRDNNRSLFLKSPYFAERVGLLSAILFLVEPKDRVQCTFDTHVDTCEPVPGDYWAVGGSSSSSSDFVMLDLSRPQVDSLNATIIRKTTPYKNWLEEQVQGSISPSSLFARVYPAQVLADCLRTSERPKQEEFDADVFQEFWQANQEIMDIRLKNIVESLLDFQIEEEFVSYLKSSWPLEKLAAVTTSRRNTAKDLAPNLFNWLTETNPKVGYWKNIMNFGISTDHAGLQLLASSQRYRPRAPITNRLSQVNAVRRKALQELTRSKDKENVIKGLVKRVPPEWIIEPETAKLISSLCDEQVLSMLSDEEFADLVMVTVEKGGASAMRGPFVSRASKLTHSRKVKSMAKLVLNDKHAIAELKNVIRQLA